MSEHYDYRNCQSLFGYAAQVHARSGGICQLCGCNAGADVDFDLWRQLTVEHLIGQSQGGHLKEIRRAVAARFPDLTEIQRQELSYALDALNTVTACSFCNSTTSRDVSDVRMDALIAETPGSAEDIKAAVAAATGAILARKRADIAWKLNAIREQFELAVRPAFQKQRQSVDGDVST